MIRHVKTFELPNQADTPSFKFLLDFCAGLVPGVSKAESRLR